jgi:hypothetical protein
VGIIEARRLQELNRLGLRHAIEIGHDGGTGFFYLILAGSETAAVCFMWKDDIPFLSPEEWNSWETLIPEDMVKVADDFDSLAELIINSPVRK